MPKPEVKSKKRMLNGVERPGAIFNKEIWPEADEEIQQSIDNSEEGFKRDKRLVGPCELAY